MTRDRGKELSDHPRFTIESGVRVFVADPRSPWQRGTNEKTNGLLRQYFPKGTDLYRWSEQATQVVARTLSNSRVKRWVARVGVFNYFDIFYNRSRRHSHLGSISPETLERAAA